jgi:HK97 family phage major capsid protein
VSTLSRNRTLFDPRVPDHDPGDIIGFRRDGSPIVLAAGGARDNFDHWIPEEFGSDVITKVRQVSALESFAQRIPMKSQTRSTPRSGGVGVDIIAKGGTYGEDTTTNDEVILASQKFGKAVRIAEEDIDDSLANVINTKMSDWATAFAKGLDNAGLAVTAAKASSGCAFDSVYFALTQNNNNTGYTANTNLTQSGTGGTTYDGLSTAAGLLESGDYWDEDAALWIAHPNFKKKLRGIKDSQQRPIFNESSNGTAGGGQNVPDTIMGYPVKWSLGAKTSAAPTSRPTGNPLAVLCNPMFLLLGIRSGPESVFIDGRDGLSALTDESILKMRARRGFAVGVEQAFAVYEDNSGS